MKETLKQEKLIHAYLECGNVAKAAKIAGYKNRQAAHHFLSTNESAKNKIIEAIKLTRDGITRRFYENVKQTDYILGKLLDAGDLKTAIRLIEVKIKYHHMLPNGLNLPTVDGNYEKRDLSKLTVAELEQLKTILEKCEIKTSKTQQ